MEKRIGRVLSMVIALVVCLAMAVPALADTVTYTPVNGQTVTLKNYLVVEKDAVILNYTFAFTLESVEASGNVKAGPGIVPTVQDVTIGAGNKLETVSAEVQAELGASYSAAANDVCAADVTLDFSTVAFNRPGVYRYRLTMDTTREVAGLTYDASTVRYVDVYVENNTAATAKLGDLKIASMVIFEAGEEAPDFSYNTSEDEAGEPIPGMPLEEGVKRANFINALDTVSLSVEKQLAGNQADPDANFDFTITVTLPDSMPLGSYVFAVAQESASGVTNPVNVTAEVTADNRTVSGGTVTLGKGGKVSVKGLPKGTSVTVSEVNGDYTATYTVNGGAEQTGSATAAQTLVSDAAFVFTNTRNGTVPTGVLLTVAPFVALMGVGFIGALLILMRKKHRE